MFREPIVNLKWDYETDGQYDPHKVAKEINGYFLQDVTVNGKNVSKKEPWCRVLPSCRRTVPPLRATGCTATATRKKGTCRPGAGKKDAPNNIGLYPEFAWCWPVNRRIIYNRASVDLKGQPWDEKDWVIKFAGNAENGKYVSKKWLGDVPDGGWYPLQNPDGSMRKDARYAFIMRKHGHGQIFGPGRADGPFPEHYEPLECPVEKNLMNAQRINPTAPVYGTAADAHATCDPRYPFVCSTYRVSEHWQTGLMTRTQPWLLELQPQVFVEISEELAALRGIENGERVAVSSARGRLECTAIVTRRFKPFKIGGGTVHQVGVPWHFGWRWPQSGTEESANLLTPPTGDPNTRIPETKAFMVNVAKL